MLFCIVGIVLAICSGMMFANRNNTHQLFEYTFLQSECENGYFNPRVFVNGSSFGVLHKKGSSECLDQSGYRNILSKSGEAAESEGTFESMLNRINTTKEFSVEMWVKYFVSPNYYEKVFIIMGENEIDVDNAISILCELRVNSVIIYMKKNNIEYESSLTSHNTNMQLIHFVFTVKIEGSLFYITSYINGTKIQTDILYNIDMNYWNSSSHLIMSRASKTAISSLYYDEVYYIGFFDHALSDDQVLHNFNCLIPPSIASIAQQEVHGSMNTLFPIQLSIRDYNMETNTNLIDNYTVYLILLSVPHQGQLYLSTMQPIYSCPTEGIILNTTTLYFQPELNEFSETEYANLTVQVVNNYGASNPKSISIFVDWVNQPLITWDCWFNITTDSPSLIEIEMLDIDGDATYTRFISISPSCSISDLTDTLILYKMQFEVWFLGDSSQSNGCRIQFVAGDSHGLESNITTYWLHAVNDLYPEFSQITVNQNELTNISLSILSSNHTLMTSEVELQLVTMPRFGEIEVLKNWLQYRSQEYYFSSPSSTIYGKSLENSMDWIEYIIIHKSISSPIYKLSIDILHKNTIPILTLPSELYFKVYESIPIQNLSLIDYDNDTQLCELQISSVSGLFYLNSTTNDPSNPLTWVSGNYGEGRDNSKVTVEGSLSAIAFALHSLSYKAMYRLNDTLQLELTDGEFIVSEKVKMVYVAEQTSVITPKFTIIVALVVGVMVLWALSLCCKICPRRKELPVTAKPKEEIREYEQKQEQEQFPQKQKQKQNKKKKIPPPPPSSSPPVDKLVMNSDEVNIMYKKTSKPPSVAY